MTDSVDAVMRELRRFREELPRWIDTIARLQEQEVRAEGGGGAIRASSTGSGDITRVEIDPYFLRAVGTERANAAILQALQAAQSTAARQVTNQQEKLQFMGFPIGELLTGKASVTDVFLDASPPEHDHDWRRTNG